jgi:hypothetical protein
MTTFSVEDGALSAPCRFCGYDGPDYYRAGTHAADCPWHSVGGLDERKARLIGAVKAASSLINRALIDAMRDRRASDAFAALRAENLALRRLLWLSHRRSVEPGVLYGDDGEMQCNGCLCDFRRAAPAEIEKCVWRCQKEK